MVKNKVRYYDNYLGYFYVGENDGVRIHFVIFNHSRTQAIDITANEFYERDKNLFKTSFGYQIKRKNKDGSVTKEDVEQHLPHPNVFTLPLGIKYSVLASAAEKVYAKLYEKYINNVGLSAKELNLSARAITLLANEQTKAQAKHKLMVNEKEKAKENIFKNWANEVAGVKNSNNEDEK